MESLQTIEKYPAKTILFANVVSAGIYLSGFFILLSLGWMFSVLFLAAVLLFEHRLIRNHCTRCYYWGKNCGFGRGRISACFYKKGDASKFNAWEITWKDLIPDILISLIPLVVGLVFLILKFNFLLLIAVLVLILLTTLGNGFVRGSLACKFCKQRELGCPAWTLFNRGT